jgi:hypothetical protein
MKCVWGLNHKNKQRPTSYTNNIHSQVPESKYQGVAASLWPVATVQRAPTEEGNKYISFETKIN